MLRLLTGRLDLTTGPCFMRLYQFSGETAEDEPQNRIERGEGLHKMNDHTVLLTDHVGHRVGVAYAVPLRIRTLPAASSIHVQGYGSCAHFLVIQLFECRNRGGA